MAIYTATINVITEPTGELLVNGNSESPIFIVPNSNVKIEWTTTGSRGAQVLVNGEVVSIEDNGTYNFTYNGEETTVSLVIDGGGGYTKTIIIQPIYIKAIGNNIFHVLNIPSGETRDVVVKNLDNEEIANIQVVGSDEDTATINLKPIGKLVFDFSDDEYNYTSDYIDENLGTNITLELYDNETLEYSEVLYLIKYANSAEKGNIPNVGQLRPTYKVPYYDAYSMDFSECNPDGSIVRNPLNGDEPFSNLIDNCIKGAMVKFFNSKAGYSYLRFDEAFNYNLSSSVLSGAVYQQNSVADNTIARGYEGERAFVCKGQFSAEYLGMIDALMVSPEVYLYGYWLDNRFFLADDTDNEFSYFRVREMETNAVSEKVDGSEIAVNITFLLAESNTFKLY